MSKIELDLSIADELIIKNVSENEEREIYFDAEESWEGDYLLTVFNSRKKNVVIEIADAITVDQTRLTWTLNPKSQGIEVGNHYCEVFSTTENAIIFKADLTIDI